MTLGLLLVAHLGWVQAAQSSLLVAVCFLILDATVERFGVLGGKGGLGAQLKLHHLGRGDQAHRHIAQPSGVMTKVHTKCAVSMVHYLARDEKI